MYANPAEGEFNPHRHYAFLRRNVKEVLLVVANFDDKPASIDLHIPQHVFDLYNMKPTRKARVVNLFTGETTLTSFTPDQTTHVDVPANGGTIFRIRTR